MNFYFTKKYLIYGNNKDGSVSFYHIRYDSKILYQISEYVISMLVNLSKRI